MFKELRAQTMKSVIFRLVAGIIAIGILLVMFGSSFINLAKGPKDLNSLSVEELPNAYVNGEIYAIVDNFYQYYIENDDGTEDVTENYYIIPVGEEEYCALELKDDYGTAEQIMNETYDYLMGTSEELNTTMDITGTLTTMDDEVYDAYLDWFKDSGFLGEISEEEISSMALPYVLTVDQIGSFDNIMVYIFLALTAVLLLTVIVNLIMSLTGGNLSHIKKFIKANESVISVERIEEDYQNAYMVEKIRLGRLFTFLITGSKAMILNNSDIVWAYLEEVTHRVNGIKTGVTKSLIIYDNKKKKYTITMKNIENVQSVLSFYAQNHPAIMLGYSDELKKCFQKNYEQFLSLAKHKSEEDSYTEAEVSRESSDTSEI